MEITTDELKTRVSAAIVAAMADADRDALVAQAIQHLMTPKEGQYGRRGETPLQETFNAAVYVYARDQVAAILKEDEAIRRRLRQAITDGINKALDEGAADRIASAINDKLWT